MEHIKITDLCVGDWVMYDLKPCIVRQIDGESDHVVISGSEGVREIHIDYIEPICIKPEMLEKNGFTLPWRKGKEWVLQSHTWRVGVTLRKNGYSHIDSDEGKFCLKNARYIHQLQHALRLAGVDKDIEL